MDNTRKTLEQHLREFSNDYSTLEQTYYTCTGSELVNDPYNSVRYILPNLTLSASVIIPTFNSRNTLEQCLIAIEQSSFNRKYRDQLEVIVVDDGSNDDTWDLLQQLKLGIHLKAIRQKHHAISHARNTALLSAKGDVIIFCDSDMILTHFSIEELMKRHQVLDKVLLFGFRSNIDANDPRIQPATIVQHLPSFLPPFLQDERLYPAGYPYSGWPENVCRDTDHLKRLGHRKKIFLSSGAWVDLLTQIWGALFSLRRSDVLALGAFDENFYGWGGEDTLIGAKAIALGNYIIPIYSAAGLHVTHQDRTPNKKEEGALNSHLLQKALDAPFSTNYKGWIDQAKQRLQNTFEHKGFNSDIYKEAEFYKPFDAILTDALLHAEYLYSLGRYPEILAALSNRDNAERTVDQEGWRAFHKGRALRANRQSAQATNFLRQAVLSLPKRVEPLIELGLALAMQNQFLEARDVLIQALYVAPSNQLLEYLLKQPLVGHLIEEKAFDRHLIHATRWAHQKDFILAVQEYEFALLHTPLSLTTQIARAKALMILGREEDVHAAHNNYINNFVTQHPQINISLLQEIWSSMMTEKLQIAKVKLEHMRQLQPNNEDIIKCVSEVNAIFMEKYVSPRTSFITEQCKSIQGDMNKEEIELLIALASRIAMTCDKKFSSLFADVRSSYGQSTIAMGLTISRLMCTNIRIVAVDEPTAGSGNWPASEILSSHLIIHNLTNIVMRSHIKDIIPGDQKFQLVVIHSKNDYTFLQQYVSNYTVRLAIGGLLLLQNYSDDFPQVQLYADKLFENNNFEFVAQAGKLIAFVKCKENGCVAQKKADLLR